MAELVGHIGHHRRAEGPFQAKAHLAVTALDMLALDHWEASWPSAPSQRRSVAAPCMSTQALVPHILLRHSVASLWHRARLFELSKELLRRRSVNSLPLLFPFQLLLVLPGVYSTI